MRIGIIGVGGIAKAIVEGLCGLADPPRVLLSPRGAAVGAELAARFDTAAVCASNQEVADGADLVIIALRTEQCAEAVAGLRLRPEQVVVNVMASVGTAQLREMLGTQVPIVRAMPLQAVRERGCVTVTFPSHPDVDALFDLLGGTLPVADEAAFTVFCGLSGTMSTHYGYLTALAAWATAHGIPGDDAERFLRSLFAGIGRSLDDPDRSLAQLRDEHETPGGSNERVRLRWFEPAEPALRDVLDALLTDLRD
ncbi:NAD(P)-binding domain-containing protein [Gordonia sp. (in: high G+C Gram-positive bacteria)]|uniref:NAD(P)-binding domain-containing protein n=1 Tax=Gordonia sp. (in: high G+C Gram-positive bacteria) TaxID=84139 RepID=UPI00261B5D9F|nr:NAD(P)-binding domain-containing protein [Gordonia sp. (in: high G+C Gram-positive bacteria)]